MPGWRRQTVLLRLPTIKCGSGGARGWWRSLKELATLPSTFSDKEVVDDWTEKAAKAERIRWMTHYRNHWVAGGGGERCKVDVSFLFGLRAMQPDSMLFAFEFLSTWIYIKSRMIKFSCWITLFEFPSSFQAEIKNIRIHIWDSNGVLANISNI